MAKPEGATMAEEETKGPVTEHAEVIGGGSPDQPSEEREKALVTEPAAEAARPEVVNAGVQQRGRMVGAAMVVAVVVALIAVLVAGIFRLTSSWLVVCPGDVPVNDPAPVLWQKMEAASIEGQPLGVPEKVLGVAGFKGRAPEAKAPQRESEK
jgi:hypothetical protein